MTRRHCGSKLLIRGNSACSCNLSLQDAMPGIWFSDVVGTTMVSMNIVNASMLSGTMCAFLNMLPTFVFLRFGNTGHIGAAWANLIAAYVGATFIFCYGKSSGSQDVVWTVAPRSADAPPPLSLKGYLAVAISSAFSLGVEWWSGIMQSIFVGWLPGADLAVGDNGVSGNTLGIFFISGCLPSCMERGTRSSPTSRIQCARSCSCQSLACLRRGSGR